LWEYVLGGATVFGVIVGLFSVYNGRATRRYIGELIKETRDALSQLIREETRLTRDALSQLIGEEAKLTRELVEKLSESRKAS